MTDNPTKSHGSFKDLKDPVVLGLGALGFESFGFVIQ